MPELHVKLQLWTPTLPSSCDTCLSIICPHMDCLAPPSIRSIHTSNLLNSCMSLLILLCLVCRSAWEASLERGISATQHHTLHVLSLGCCVCPDFRILFSSHLSHPAFPHILCLLHFPHSMCSHASVFVLASLCTYVLSSHFCIPMHSHSVHTLKFTPQL